MKTVFLRDVTLSSFVHVYRRFGETCLPNVTEDRNVMIEVFFVKTNADIPS